MSEKINDEVEHGAAPGDFEIEAKAEAAQPAEAEFRIVRLEAEDPEVVRQRNGLHAGRLSTRGIQRRGRTAGDGWRNFS